MLDIKEYAPIIDSVVPETSKEYELIVDTYRILLEGLPTTVAQAHSRLSALDTLRPQLTAMIYMMSNKITNMSRELSMKYNKDYTRWCNAGTKPSHAAIEAQIYRDDPDMMALKYKIDDYNNLMTFVSSLIRSIDQARSSVIEAWHDAQRY